MKPGNPDLVDRLAAEYVLGTLRGPARRRFERWRANTPDVDRRCRYWEEHLMHVAKGLKPVQPPAHVWPAIRKRLNLTADRSPRRWARNWAVAASLVLVAGLAGLLYWRSLPGEHATAFATISAKSGDEIWQVKVFGTTNRLVVQAEKLPPRPAGRDYELWALPKGGNPVSLGVLPAEGTSTRALTAIQKAALASSSQLAVSIEPPGGSPTGQPTGDIVFMAPLRASG
jgi:anti-sigma-K factor RskA